LAFANTISLVLDDEQMRPLAELAFKHREIYSTTRIVQRDQEPPTAA
jgi:hypothetical protein